MRYIYRYIIFALLFVLTLANQNLFAQDNIVIRQLESKIDTTHIDSVQIKYLLELVWELRKTNPQQSLSYGYKTLKFAESIKYIPGVIKSYNYIGIAYRNLGNFILAIEFYEKSLSLAQKYHDNLQIAYCYINLGNAYMMLGNYTKTLEFLVKASQMAEKNNDQSQMAYAYLNLSRLMLLQGKNDDALNYQLKTLNIRQKLNDTYGIGVCYTEIGRIYLNMNKNTEALSYFEMALKINEEGNYKSDIAYNSMFIGMIYEKNKNREKAIYYFQQSINTVKETGDLNILAQTYNKLAYFYLNQQNYLKALDYSQEALATGENIKALEIQKDATDILHQVYYQKLNFNEAYIYLLKNKKLNDSLLDLENAQKIAQLETTYATENQQKIIEQQEQKNKQYRFVLFLIIIFLSVIIFIVIIAWYFQGKYNRLLKQQNIEIQDKNKKIQIQNLEIEDAYNSLKKSDEELRSLNVLKNQIISIIGHDLRTPVGNMRSLLELALNAYQSEQKVKLGQYIDLSLSSVNQAFGLLENLLYWAKAQQKQLYFKKEWFDINEIVKTNIELFTTNIKQRQINIVTDFKDPVMVLADKNMIDTVLRNIISNAIKFTNYGGTINILAKSVLNGVLTEISDNGIGIKQELIPKILSKTDYISTYGTNAEKGAGLGLKICIDFIERHQGHLNITSEEGAGSIFSFFIPNTETT